MRAEKLCISLLIQLTEPAQCRTDGDSEFGTRGSQLFGQKGRGLQLSKRVGVGDLCLKALFGQIGETLEEDVAASQENLCHIFPIFLFVIEKSRIGLVEQI